MHEAARIIKDEHTSIAAVLHGLRYLLRDAERRGQTPDFRVLHAMLDYIVAFPERLHHPKEDRFLFSAVRERAPQAEALLQQLQADHAAGDRLLRELQQALLAYEHGNRAAPAAAFREAVEAYAQFHWAHMNREENELLPLAERVLTEHDWERVAAAFRANDDPLFGVRPRAEMQDLFRRIVNIAPPPIGVGPAPPL